MKKQYDGNALLDGLKELKGLNTDYKLSKWLQIQQTAISSIRRGQTNITANHLIRMHELSGLPIKELRAMMGDTEGLFTGSRVKGK